MAFDTLLARVGLGKSRPLVNVLRLAGPIGQVGAFRNGLTLASLAGLIEQAFRPKDLKAVALAINSPGGSPVQSALIHRRIRALAKEKGVPVFSFCEDVAASGGYWLACAGDEIYADESSILGSIGVISAGFGFHEAIGRIGVERRVYTQGTRKGLLDPFRPEDPDDVARIVALQADIFESFKDLVRTRRNGHLKAPEEELFTGDIWAGKRALELGLIDGLGDMRSVMRERFGDKVRLNLIGERKGWLRRRFGMTAPEPAQIAAEMLSAVEERALWGRYGL
ncbi:S49 family peptidase [Telmatospirillum sp. J64-1]|uniref:S49 family peptidase n=1 Tax=Telmatospirillum sp. J64-1 TaxID=2502183 RepID=UPI00115E047C|nr:S49 family peptidase [Telmatospirillum sp. J64-1]